MEYIWNGFYMKQTISKFSSRDFRGFAYRVLKTDDSGEVSVMLSGIKEEGVRRKSGKFERKCTCQGECNLH